MGLGLALEHLTNEPIPIRRLGREALARTALGALRFRYRMGALRKTPDASLYEAASLAKRLSDPKISVREFSVVGGNGLV